MENYKPAGFWIRFLANIIDSVLIYILAVLIAFIIGDNLFFNPPDTLYTSVSEDTANLVYLVIFIIIFTASKFKGSPGKLVCRIQVLNIDMTKISILKSIGRVLAYIVSAIPLFIGFMMAGWNKEKKALHDMICGTRVVYRNK